LYTAEKWVAAAGEGRTVNRDWSSKHCGRFGASKILLVLFVLNRINLIQILSINLMIDYKTVNEKPVRNHITGTLG